MNYILIAFLIIIFIGLCYFLYNKYIKKDPTLFIPNDEYKSELKKTNSCDIILFSADWCPHCKEIQPEWEKYTGNYYNKKYNVQFRKILGDDDSSLVEKYNIDSYPSIILIRDGVTYEYDSNFSKESMDLFIETIMDN
jgi:thiol-disulfide isomerase/thioredoxin